MFDKRSIIKTNIYIATITIAYDFRLHSTMHYVFFTQSFKFSTNIGIQNMFIFEFMICSLFDHVSIVKLNIKIKSISVCDNFCFHSAIHQFLFTQSLF